MTVPTTAPRTCCGRRMSRVVTGRNMGIAWNKNRALFLLGAIAQCDVVILLEDDSFPTSDGWDRGLGVGNAAMGARQPRR